MLKKDDFMLLGKEKGKQAESEAGFPVGDSLTSLIFTDSFFWFFRFIKSPNQYPKIFLSLC